MAHVLHAHQISEFSEPNSIETFSEHVSDHSSYRHVLKCYYARVHVGTSDMKSNIDVFVSVIVDGIGDNVDTGQFGFVDSNGSRNRNSFRWPVDFLEASLKTTYSNLVEELAGAFCFRRAHVIGAPEIKKT